METVDLAPSSRRVPRWVWLAAAGVAMATLAGAWFVTAPDEVATPGATVGLPVEVGESSYVGYYYLSERDLRIEAIEPVTLNGLAVSLWLCDPVPDTDPRRFYGVPPRHLESKVTADQLGPRSPLSVAARPR